MRDEMVAERLKELDDSCYSLRNLALGNTNCDGISCKKCTLDSYKALADMIEAEQAELRDLLDFQRDTFTRERDCLCKDIEELKRKTSEYKRMLDFRKKLAGENGVVLKGLRDFANTSKHHSNAEWKRIVMHLTENAEDHANRVIAEAVAQAKEKQNGVDIDALLKVADEMADLACVPSYKRASSVDMSYVAKWWRQIASAVKGAAWLKPDTQEDIDADAALSFAEYTRKWPCPIDRADDSAAWHREHLLARQRKLLGGESYE